MLEDYALASDVGLHFGNVTVGLDCDSIAILLVLQASVTEIDYDTVTVHSILSFWYGHS